MAQYPSWLRDPVVVFFALGLAIFAAYSALSFKTPEAITLSAAGHAVLIRDFELLAGRPASDADQQRLVEQYFRREVLFREALRTGLQRSDSGVRAALIESMQQQITGELPEPDAAQLVGYYAEHMNRYYSEVSMSVDQVFFRDPPGDSDALLEALRGGANTANVDAPALDFRRLGDPPPQGRSFPDYGHSMLRGLFGQALLATMQALPLARWEGPFESADGWHFFRVRARKLAKPLPFERVQNQVRIDYQAEEIAERVERYLDGQRERYQLELSG